MEREREREKTVYNAAKADEMFKHTNRTSLRNCLPPGAPLTNRSNNFWFSGQPFCALRGGREEKCRQAM